MTKQQLEVVNQTNFPNNNTGYISAQLLREFNTDMIDNNVNQAVYSTDSASVNSRLTAQEAFSSSIAIDYINQSELNSATQSLSASLAASINGKALSSSFNSFTSSTNGRLDFLEAKSAFISQSNVFNQDNTFSQQLNVGEDLNVVGKGSFTGSLSSSGIAIVGSSIFGGNAYDTSSFNGFVKFNNPEKVYFGTQNWIDFSSSVVVLLNSSSAFPAFSSSVQGQINSLKDWSSSLDLIYATDAELTQSINNLSSSLTATINTKLDSAITGAFLTTGSANVVQNISGGITLLDNQNFTVKNGGVANLQNTWVKALITTSSVTIGAGGLIATGSLLTTDNVIAVGYISASGIVTGSNFSTLATTGSNTFTGNQTVNARVYVSSSNQYDVVLEGQLYISSSGTTATTRPLIVISGSAGGGGTNTIRNNNIDVSAPSNAGYVRVTNSFTSWQSTLGPSSINIAGGGTIGLSANTASFSLPTLYGNDGVSDVAVIQLATSAASASILVPTTFTKAINITGSVNISGSLTISGSQNGNVTALTVSSNTASIDMSKGNFFTLTIPSSSITFITATNINAGQTVGVKLLQQATTGSVLFDSKFKFWSGSQGINTGSAAAGAVDILTFVSFDTASLYSTLVRNLV